MTRGAPQRKHTAQAPAQMQMQMQMHTHTRTQKPTHLPTHRGFTLIEILVALAITSIALMAGMQASSALTRLSLRQSDQLLAQLCADNELAKVRLSRQLPGVGRSETTCTQARQSYRVALEVLGTPNPNFRRVDVRVHPADPERTANERDITLLQVSTVVGRY